jgi:hypothetical protein
MHSIKIFSEIRPGKVAYAHNPTCSGDRDQEDCSLRGNILGDPISTNKKLGVLVYACHLNCTGSVNRIAVQASLGINDRFYFKNT